MPTFFCAVFALSAPTNLLALILLLQMKKNPNIIFMINLAAADLLYTLTLPFTISYRFNNNDWFFGQALCGVIYFISFYNMYCSILILTAVSVDRYLGIVYSLAFRYWRTNRYATVVSCTIWFVVIGLLVPRFINKETLFVENLNITTCIDVTISQNGPYGKSYAIVLLVLLFFLPLCIILFCYHGIIKQLNDPNTISKHKRKKTTALMAIVTLVVFVVCFTPIHALMLFRLLPSSFIDPDWAYSFILVFSCLSSINCFLDAFLYYFASARFRAQIKNLLYNHKI
ncbi:proteinase-activated receptor 1-like [Latimeria chalumnae]|uniref:proteinase-activated receptor 1-like n=1 Tax=Latimeria chalumnae TaxID=7897 RepID=UPI00313B3400